MYKDIVIVSAVRTPFGRYCGSLREYDYFDLGALPMKEVLERVNVAGEEVDEVYWGCWRHLSVQRCLHVGSSTSDPPQSRAPG